jgi:SAM-dependent methyltransferase
VLKQEKLREIERLLPPLEQKTCLDIGGDNGVVSYLLRQKGGTWHSADMAETVEAIREIVGQNVHPLEGASLPFPDKHFDLVVVIDYLEHIHDDHLFVEEVFRVLKPGGELILNVPHAKRGAVLRPVRVALGLTDEQHGHVRPGYRESELRQLLDGLFTIRAVRTYSRFFSHLIDMVFGLAHARFTKGEPRKTSKGAVVTQADFEGDARAFLLSSLLYPICWFLVRLDRLLFFTKGYLLIIGAEKAARGLE